MKSFFIFASVLFFNFNLTFSQISQYSTNNDENTVYDEEFCTAFGGNCMLKSLCRLYERGLPEACPKQMHKDVICCYGYSKEELKCAKRNGSCIDRKAFCHRFLTFTKASDCPVGTKCCMKPETLKNLNK